MKMLFGSILVISFLSLSSAMSFAKDISPTIDITDAKIFAPMKGSNTTAGYGTIKNLSSNEVMVKVIEASPFKAVETHETKEKAGKMGMEKVASFKIPAKGILELKPGGNHIMLFDATREIKAGEELTIGFDVDGKRTNMKFKVESRTEAAHDHH